MRKGPAILIANAIIWGAVIIGCSFKLKGTGAYEEIQNILAAGAGISLFFILAGVVLPDGKKKKAADAKADS
jgi:hypothetical protein